MSPTLPTRALGRNGPQVTALGVGLMSLGHAYGKAGDDEERYKFLDKAHSLGETFWDSADLYGDNEELIGKWFKRTGKRDDIFLSTKFAFLDPVKPSLLRSDPEYVMQACDASLKKLGIETIDLYYCHRVDGKTPIEKTVQAMAELKKQGKINYLGLSEVSATTLRRAHAVHPIAAVQTEYSPFTLDIESPQTQLLATCKELGIALVAYSPLGRGFLTGGIKTRADIADDFRIHLPRFSEENFPKSMAIVDKIRAIADRNGSTVGQVTLAWLMAQWEGVIPIPGTKRATTLEENVNAMQVRLSEGEIKEIREVCENAGDLGGRYPDGWGMMEQLFADTPEL